MGEHLEWAKYSNFRVATNIPLFVHVPGLMDKRQQISSTIQSGMVSSALVELVDLFPTLAELTGIEVPGKQTVSYRMLICTPCTFIKVHFSDFLSKLCKENLLTLLAFNENF